VTAKNNIKSYIELHFIILIWGFTAILGKLVSLEAIPLVWYRLLLSLPFLLAWILYRKFSLKITLKNALQYIIGGLLIALHWVAFFMAIKVSNISIALVTMSTGAFFASLLEPLFFKRKIQVLEVIFGVFIIGGLYLIFQVNQLYLSGILWALLAAFLSALFSVLNGLFVKRQNGYVLSLYQLFFGFIGISLFLLFKGDFNSNFFQLSSSDWWYLLILSSVCTAYAFAASIDVMKYLSPYTVMLSINLEPVYAILLALVIFGESEKMQSNFYYGAGIIIAIVIANTFLKKKLESS